MEKILIIEDEDLVREAIADFLTVEGYECLQAANGREGIISAQKNLPDLIICDIKMPELNGHEVLNELRLDSTTSSIPFIFLSALVNKEDLRKGMELGADDYITKPFQPDELLRAIRTRIAKRLDFEKKIDTLRQSIAHSLPHELRTPLVSIVGYAQLLMEKFSLDNDNEAYEYARFINDAGLRLNHLIQNFIIYTKLESLSKDTDKISQLESEPHPVSEALLEPVLIKTAQNYSREEDLNFDIRESEVKITANDLSLIIQELTDNAFKFSSPGTPVNIKGLADKKEFFITISDRGRGMTKDQIASVGPYVQFEREKYEQQGAGLGLTIAKKLTEMYGGKLIINSVYEKGTEVIVTLPAA